MDNKNLILLSKFCVSARRLMGSVNPARLLKDTEYCAEIFQKAFEVGDEELITLTLEVQTMLGFIAPVTPTEKPAKVVAIKPADEIEKKYMFGARS